MLKIVRVSKKKNFWFQLVVLSCLLAVANAGVVPSAYGYAAAPAVAYAHAPLASTAVGSQSQSVYRSPDGNHAVSTYSKAVDTAFSSVRKYDTRVSNDAIAYAPAVAHAPLAYAAPAVAHAPVAYAAPAYARAPVAYAAPAYAHAPIARVAAPAVAHPAGLLGVAYSAAPAVAHISYQNGYGISYAY